MVIVLGIGVFERSLNYETGDQILMSGIRVL